MKWLRLILALCVLIMPLVVGVLLLSTVNGTPAQLKPFWSDEVYYTQQARAFQEAGFNGGYFTISEQEPRLSYSHFYTWSAFIPAFYGILGTNIMLINAVLLTLSIGISLWVLRLNNWRALVCYGLVSGLYPPLIFLLPSAMQDVLHMAIAIIVALLFIRLIDQPHRPILLVIVLAVSMLARPTWGILIFPALLLADTQLNWKRAIGWGILSAIIILPIAVLFQWSSAPYPHFRSTFFEELQSPLDAISGMFNYFNKSLQMVFNEGITSVRLQRASIGAILVISGVWAITRKDQRREMLFHVFHLGVVYVAVIALHEVVDGRDYRVMGAHVLVVLLIFAWRARWAWVLVFVISVAVVSEPLMNQYREGILPRLRVGDPVWEIPLEYTPQTNAWCNTISYSFYYIIDFTGNVDTMLAVDAGIGLSWINPDNIPTEFKAAYLMLTHDDYNAWGQNLDLTYLAEVQNGAIYSNNIAKCE
jgi:hypothetical protein